MAIIDDPIRHTLFASWSSCCKPMQEKVKNVDMNCLGTHVKLKLISIGGTR